MTHQIHQTEGLIMDSNEYGEAGKILQLLTPHFGIITLFAVGVREQKSKMRSSLNIGTQANFDFVEGKEVRRLTGVFEKKVYTKIFESVEKRNVYLHIVSFLKRVVLGEVEHADMFDSIILGLDYLENIVDKSFDLEIIEIIIILNILSHLGYWEKDTYTNFSERNFKYIESQKKEIVAQINSSIKITNL